MQSASIASFLRTGQLSTFRATTPRESVLAALGQPPFWGGRNDIAFSDSSIWVYDTIQLNFDDDLLLDGILIRFDCKFSNGELIYSDWHNSYFSFDDLCIPDICTPDKMRDFLNQHDIPTQTEESSGSRIFINTTSGTQARFARKTDHARSMQLETRISTDSAYLHMLATAIVR